jgi:hypothetical protein
MTIRRLRHGDDARGWKSAYAAFLCCGTIPTIG